MTGSYVARQGVRPAVPLGRTGGGADPAGHPRRTAARRRHRHPGLLHPGRGRHPGRRGWPALALRRLPAVSPWSPAKETRDRRPDVRPGAGHPRRLRPRAGPHSATGTATSSSRSPPQLQPAAAMAGQITIAEVEELVAPGEIPPDEVHAGIFVRRFVARSPRSDKRIERRTTARQQTDAPAPNEVARSDTRRAGGPAAMELLDGSVRQPGHRAADPDPQPHARRRARGAAVGERHPRRRPVPGRGRRSTPTSSTPARRP